MKFKKLALISATSLILTSTCIPALNATNTTTQTVLAAKKKKIKKTKVKKTKSLRSIVLKDQKDSLYKDRDYIGPKPNPQLEKLFKKFAKNAHDADEFGYTVRFKAKRNTTSYRDVTDYENYDENGDPIKPNQMATKKIKKGTIIEPYTPHLQLTNNPFLGRNIFKNKVILVGYFDDEGYDERYYYMDDFDVIK